MKPRYSVIIPTLNETHRLRATLVAARAAFAQDAEFIVSDGGSTDDTADIAAAEGAVVLTGAAARGEQLDRGFRSAHGTVCVFLHADTLLPRSAAAAIAAALADGDTIGGAFSVELGDDRKGLRLLERAINLRTRVFRTATGDQVIFARTAVLHAIGGVPHVPLFEDVRLCRALKRTGQFVILQERVETSARLWQKVGTSRGIALHLSFRLLHALGVSPAFLARFYPAAR